MTADRSMDVIFQNRTQAGEKLARELQALSLVDPIVLAIPRGGVPVGAAIARVLACPFDVIPLMKIPIPWSPEASYGVVAMDGTRVLNMPLVNRLDLSEREIEMAAMLVLEEAKKKDYLYRRATPFPELKNRTVVLTDDGLASGYSMLAGAGFVKKRGPLALIVASPVSSDMAHKIIASAPGVGRIVILDVDSEPLFSLRSYYREFNTVADNDVVRELTAAQQT
jgi:putative phosphoribosyl transferase